MSGHSRSLLVHGGPILTMNPALPVAEAMLIEGHRISAVGSLADVTAVARPGYEDLDLTGRLATPGLNDAHAHIMGVGFAQRQVDVSADNASSIADIRRLVAARLEADPGDHWIVGQGYDQASLSEGRHPTRDDLDDLAPDRPVLLWRSCHHIAVANGAALRAAGVDRSTPQPTDGSIGHDQHGEPNGVLRESAAASVAGVPPQPSSDEIAAALRAGGLEFRRNGIMSATEAGIRRREEFQAYQRLWNNGDLPLRTNLMMIIDETFDELASLGISSGFGDDWLRIGPAKLFADGSIGGRTARLREPYIDDPDNLGIWMIPPDEIHDKVRRAHDAGFQIGIHAIGDAAIACVVDAYEAAQHANPRPEPRHRIEHCSLPDESLLKRIAALDIVPIPGTSFLHYMRRVYLQNLGGERVRHAYAMQTFQRLGIVAAASSDAPVVPVNPLLGIQTMVSRIDRHGDSIVPEEAVSLEHAIAAYTVNAAYASFDERRKGSIMPGMLADVTIFHEDLRDIDPQELAKVDVDVTISDGAVVWER